MLTNKQIKLINSLHSKKGRIDNQLFLVEGEKAILELVNSKVPIEFLVICDHQASPFHELFKPFELYIEEEALITKLSTLVTNAFGFAVVSMKHFSFHLEYNDQITVVLDGIRDPGNLGTIIRICDWYGIKQILFSPDCTDFFNPKVISASMGSYTRINFHYQDLSQVFESNPSVPIFGALLDGTDVHTMQFPSSFFLLLGNESNGIREENMKYISQKVTIPRYGLAESLNVGISTAIILDNLKRN
jgi:TrmH family RNA methyltransferase